jgi:hypothetical protein
MKVCFTEREVEQIIIEYVQRTVTQKLNEVRINNYSGDYCVVTYVEPEPATETN